MTVHDETNSKPLLIELLIRIKTYDVDWIGHVNNIVYVRWLEDLRLELLDRYFPLEPLRQQGIVPIIVNTNIHYRKGIVLAEHEVVGSMWVSEIGQAAFYLAAEFVVDGDIRCTATQRGTFVNQAEMRPIRLPQGFIDACRGGADLKA